MAFAYFPHTQEDIVKMLNRVGLSSPDDLFADVPADALYHGEYDIPEAMSEAEVRCVFEKLASMNLKLKVFCGGGAYDHYSPSVIPYILSRSEFMTAYTPYQAEVSQGTLRYIFEYQTMMAVLTGMDVSNASMYDGATSAAEAAMMMLASTKRKTKVVVSDSLFPQVVEVIRTYGHYHGIDIVLVPHKEGVTDKEAMMATLAGGDVAGLIVPSVSKFGIIEDLSWLADAAHAVKSLLTVYCDPSALAVLKTPGEWGADIACGEAQSLGIPLSFGGPYLGFLTCRQEFVRKLPGRIVGETTDVNGKRSYVLTLQAREQHIRREKATSNICSNQSLMALYVTVYLSLMGADGLREVNSQSCAGAHYLYDRLLETGKFAAAFNGPFLKEFALRSLVPVDALGKALVKAGFFGGLPIEGDIVTFCVTENRSQEEMDALVDAVKSITI